VNKRTQHGKRNLPEWQRVSHRERARLAARQAAHAASTATALTEETARSLNQTIVRLEALIQLVLATAHTHPDTSRSGIVFLRGSGAPPAEPVNVEQFNALVRATTERFLAAVGQAPGLEAPATEETNAQGG
jgi:hypothetical protein